MEISPSMIKPISVGAKEKSENPSEAALESFSNILSDSIEQVSALQKNADAAVEKFVAGELDIADVMIETEKAGTALQLTLQLRNKVLEAYQEIMRMQV